MNVIHNECYFVHYLAISQKFNKAIVISLHKKLEKNSYFYHAPFQSAHMSQLFHDS